MIGVRRAPFDLLVVVDPRDGAALEGLGRLGQHCRGDRIAVQLRAKDASTGERLVMARALAGVQPPGSLTIVNGDVALARLIAADGVHLPEASGPVREARAQLAQGALVGASCHDEAGVRRRSDEGADYVVLGPLGEVPGKPSMARDEFARIARATAVPIVALGGLASLVDAEDALALGAAAIAVQRAILAPGAPDWLAAWLASRQGARPGPG
ncbi:MAG: thiamine phosphate synthase [Sandaracinus sp.]